MSSILGPCCPSAATMVMSECASLPLASFGAPLDGSLWHFSQFFSANTFLPRSALPLLRKYWRAQRYEMICRISSCENAGGGFFMLGWWFHMSTAISVRVALCNRDSSASLPTWHSEQPLD